MKKFFVRDDGLHSDPGKAGNLLERLAKSSLLVDNGFVSLDWLRIGKYSETCIIKVQRLRAHWPNTNVTMRRQRIQGSYLPLIATGIPSNGPIGLPCRCLWVDATAAAMTSSSLIDTNSCRLLVSLPIRSSRAPTTLRGVVAFDR